MNGMAFGPYSMTPGLPGFGSLVVFHGLRPTPTREGSRNKFWTRKSPFCWNTEIFMGTII